MSQPWSPRPTPPQGEGQSSWSPTQPPNSRPRQALTAAWWFWVGLAVVVVAAGGVGFLLGRSSAGPSPSERAAAAATEASRLQTAFDSCEGKDVGDTLSLGDNGHSIVIDTGSEYGDPTGYACVIEDLGVPESIRAQMDRTTALQGVQEASHDGMSFSWSYHPDNGVNMVITDEG
jgi:hypothetical protein